MRLRTAIALAVLSTLALSCAAGRRDTGAAAPTLEDQLPKLAFRPPPDFAAVPDSLWINGPVSVQLKLADDGRVRVARIYTAYLELKDPRPSWAAVVDSIVLNAARRAIFRMPANRVDLETWIPLDYTLPADAVGWPHDRLVGWTGRVVDRDTRQPVPGAYVFVIDERLGSGVDAAGTARIPSLRAGRFALRTIAWGYAERVDSVTVAATTADTVIALTPNAAAGGKR
jgi:hypothetical protein